MHSGLPLFGVRVGTWFDLAREHMLRSPSPSPYSPRLPLPQRIARSLPRRKHDRVIALWGRM